MVGVGAAWPGQNAWVGWGGCTGPAMGASGRDGVRQGRRASGVRWRNALGWAPGSGVWPLGKDGCRGAGLHRCRVDRVQGMSKRVLLLSWEYPPVIEGGLARHVRKLAEALVRQGVTVDVLTRGVGESTRHREPWGRNRAPRARAELAARSRPLRRLGGADERRHARRPALRWPRSTPTTSSTDTTGSSRAPVPISPTGWACRI